MDTRIGNILFFYVLFFLKLSLFCNVEIKVTDIKGRQISTAKMGIPFIVEALIDGSSSSLDYPSIDNFSNLKNEGVSTSSSIRTINGSTTIKKSRKYRVISTETGNFQIGPAYIVDNGSKIESEKINISVEANTQEDNNSNNNSSKKNETFLKIFFDKKDVFVGQEMNFIIRFYYQLQDVKIESVQQPDFVASFNSSKLNGPFAGTESINGSVFNYLEWNCKLYPKSSGQVILQPIFANFSSSLKMDENNGHPFDLFFNMSDFFSNQRRSQQIYSNAAECLVKELPPFEIDVKAIGNYSSFNAKLSNEKAKVQEGIVLTLELIGPSQINTLNHIALKLPEGLKSYESNMKVNVLDSKNIVFKKDFEYIVQAINPGNYIIESQEFIYFDAERQEYKKIYTKPLSLKIDGIIDNNLNSNIDDQIINVDNSLPKIFEIEKNGKWLGSDVEFISWNKFYLLLLIPFLSFLLFIIINSIFDLKRKHQLFINKKLAFKIASKKFNSYKQAGQVKPLFQLFLDIFAARCKVDSSVVSCEFMQEELRLRSVSLEKIELWNLFIVQLSQASYTAEYYDDMAIKLFSQVQYWISTLETIL